MEASNEMANDFSPAAARHPCKRAELRARLSSRIRGGAVRLQIAPL
jgi:hypothetical protein